MQSLDQWLGDTKWDVIHFNAGLHDLCYRHPEAQNVGNRDKVKGTQAVPPQQYEKNLETIVLRLKKTGAKIIFANTTVVPEGEPGRKVGDDLRYNEVAAKVMARNAIPVNDLHALTASFPKADFRKRGDVHFTPTGSQKLATQVSGVIAEAMKK